MQRKFIAILLTITFLSGCMSNAVKESNEPEFFGEVIKGNKTIEDFMLLTSENDTYNFKNRTEGKVVVIAFLFTNCYDICPVVTYNMRMMQESFNQTVLDSVEFITITVDPWRDNVTTLHEWKTRTKSNWTHLTVNDTESDSNEMKTLNAVWANFDVGFKIEENQSSTTSGRHHPGDYNVNHSTGTILVDHLGNQRVWWGDFDWIVDLVTADVITLVNNMPENK